LAHSTDDVQRRIDRAQDAVEIVAALEDTA
jgi:hypothetical protein